MTNEPFINLLVVQCASSATEKLLDNIDNGGWCDIILDNLDDDIRYNITKSIYDIISQEMAALIKHRDGITSLLEDIEDEVK